MIANIKIWNDKKDRFYEFSFDENHIFLGTEEGEGMGIKGSELFNIIDKYFKENM